MGAQQHIYAVF